MGKNSVIMALTDNLLRTCISQKYMTHLRVWKVKCSKYSAACFGYKTASFGKRPQVKTKFTAGTVLSERVTTCSGARPASCSMNTYFLSWRCSGRGMKLTITEVKNKWSYTSTPHIRLHGVADTTPLFCRLLHLFSRSRAEL